MCAETMIGFQDAYGHALWDYLRGKGRGYEVIERDDGYVDISGGRAMYLADYPNWPPRHRRALAYARGRVLDVGCGAGRHALYLQGKGLEVLGIDTSPLAVKVCRHRGLQHVRVMSLNQVSPALGTFSTVLMLGNNFGLFANRTRARRLLRRLHRTTSRDARIIAESVDIYQTDNPFHRRYHRRNRQKSRMAGQVRMRVRYQQYATPWSDYLFVSRREMENVVGGTGWAVKRFIPPRGPLYVAVIFKADRVPSSASG
jgi:SAM-dependent methyltransferase